MSIIVTCQSDRHNLFTNGNRYCYHTDNPPPAICPHCSDPWVPSSLHSEEALQQGLQWAMESKQKPRLNSNNEIVLEWMYFTDAELMEIVKSDRRRDVIKAALAENLLTLRSAVRPLGDYDWINPNKPLNASWVAGHVNTVIKWTDFLCRGIDIHKALDAVRGVK